MTSNQRENQLEAIAKHGYKLQRFNKNKGYWGHCKLEYITEDDIICIKPFKGLKVETNDFGKGFVEKVFESEPIMLVKFESMKSSIMCHSFEYVTMHNSSDVKYLFIEI